MEDPNTPKDNDTNIPDDENNTYEVRLLMEELKNMPYTPTIIEDIKFEKPGPELLATDKLPEVKQIHDLFLRAILDFYLVNMDAYYNNSIGTLKEHEKDWFFGTFPDDNHDSRDYAIWFLGRKNFTSLKNWRMPYNLFIAPKRTTENYIALAVLSYCDKLEHDEATKLPKDKQKYYASILKATFQKAVNGEDIKDLLEQNLDI